MDKLHLEQKPSRHIQTQCTTYGNLMAWLFVLPEGRMVRVPFLSTMICLEPVEVVNTLEGVDHHCLTQDRALDSTYLVQSRVWVQSTHRDRRVPSYIPVRQGHTSDHPLPV